MFNGTGFQDIVGDGPFGPIFHMSPPPAGVAWLKTDLLIVDDYRNMLATLETSRGTLQNGSRLPLCTPNSLFCFCVRYVQMQSWETWIGK